MLAHRPAIAALSIALAIASIVLGAQAKQPREIANASEIGKRTEPADPRARPVLHRSISLAMGKSRMIALNEPVRDVLISNPKVAEAVVRTAWQVYLIGAAEGEATAFFIGHDGGQILALDISVERDLSRMQAMLRRHFPEARIEAEAVNGGILLSGHATDPAMAARAKELAAQFAGERGEVVSLITVGSKRQVLLKVTIAEVNRSAMQRLGVDIKSAAATVGNVAVAGVAETGFALTSGAVPSASLNAASGLINPPGAGGALAAGWRSGGAGVELLLDVLERQGHVRTLAEPVLNSVSRETASFLAGGEFPIPVARDKEEVSVEWKNFGVALSFTPEVAATGRISLKVATEVSDLSADGSVQSGGLSIPALKVRRASSTVELDSGQSMVIAGLISDDVKKSLEGVPGLRRLPVLGRLFSSEDYMRAQTELVVIVTPVLADPAGVTPYPAAAPTRWRATVAPLARAISDTPAPIFLQAGEEPFAWPGTAPGETLRRSRQ